MSYIETPISAANVFSLSASYAYDDKLNFNPTLYKYDNGYSLFEQPIFNGTKDVKFANDSFFAITSSMPMESIMSDVKWIDPTELVIYTAFKLVNGKYVTNIGDKLYGTGTSIGPAEFFRVSKNTNGTYSISQNNLYATVVTDNFDIELQEKISPDTNNVQSFTFYTANTQDTYTIKASFKIPAWSAKFPVLERFLSYYDADSTNIIKAIGMIQDKNYVDENNYKLTTEGGSDTNIFAIGYDGTIKWVKYYNELLSKFFNKTVDIKEVVSDVKNNYLVEYPYKTKIDVNNNGTGSIKLNLLGLKNVMTPEYTYGKRYSN